MRSAKLLRDTEVKGFMLTVSSAGRGGIDRTWSRVRIAAGLHDVRLHDLRHSFASIAVKGGMSLHMVGKLLGHRNTSTTMRYAHLSAESLKAATETIGADIFDAISM
jgi:site-specific recombinase XerD